MEGIVWDDAAARLGLALLLAVLPGLLRHLRGRRLLRRLGDPLLPELYLHTVVRLTLLDAAALAVSLVLAWTHALLLIGLWTLARVVALYPVRRRVYGATWGLFGY